MQTQKNDSKGTNVQTPVSQGRSKRDPVHLTPPEGDIEKYQEVEDSTGSDIASDDEVDNTEIGTW